MDTLPCFWSNSTGPKGSVLTANRPTDGVVVFLDFEGDWSENLAVAVIARAPDERRALKDRGRYEAERLLVVEPHLVEIEEMVGQLIPIRHGAPGRSESAGASAELGGPGRDPCKAVRGRVEQLCEVG